MNELIFKALNHFLKTHLTMWEASVTKNHLATGHVRYLWTDVSYLQVRYRVT